MADPAFEANGRPVAREAFYAIACDPARSVAVEACAGAGKTWMLVSRMLRALLEGTPPEEILAITFTRKAAGEMRQRLQEWLQAFARAPQAQLREELRMRGLDEARAAALAPALRELQARLLAGGRGVQVRTFHSWFAALLRSAPLATLEELGLPARHELLEDDARAVEQVWRRFHTAVAADPHARADYQACVRAHGRWQTLKALSAALSKRVEFGLADARSVVEASVRPWQALHPEFAGAGAPQDVLARPGPAWEALAVAARALGRASAPTFSACGVQLERALAEASLDGVLGALLTQKLEPRKFSEKVEGIEQVRHAQALALRLCQARAQHEAWEHQQRLARLTRLLVAHYAALKRDEGWVDMADVEQAAHRLLADDVLAGWVQERLDARVSQLLVDEFQDTNPLQWQALHAWLSGYAGAGTGAPSVFIVGDPKQSIYRFRRAEPQVFAAAQRFVRDGLGGDLLSCDHTHRNAPEVIALVNAVMGQAQQAGEYAGFRPHTTASTGAGSLLRLPPIVRPADGPADAGGMEEGWRDSLTTPRELPEERLVALECRQAARWIAGRLAAGASPADVMVLARRRDRLMAMEEELRQLRVPAQQPEKSDLADACEVQDLCALLDVLVSPAHDLSLARALKSPLFRIADDDLVALAVLARERAAAGAPRPWLELLQDGEATLPPALAGAAVHLARWKGWVDRWPPHDALHAIYRDGDVLARYAAAVPPALRDIALANLRALPAAALQVEGGRYATPYAFVRALKAGGLAAPAAAAADAVRLLTVHGAKGLEAPIVLLLDTDAAPARPEGMGVLLDWPGEAPAPTRFTFLVSESRPPGCNAEPLALEQAARRREELNALYVAMTRARHTLVLSSVAPRQPVEGSWWRRLSDACTEEPVGDGAIAVPEGLQDAWLPEVPEPPAAPAAGAPPPAADSPEARLGQAVHRLLEWRLAGREAHPARLARVAREFALDPAAFAAARTLAARIATGEGAWAWDSARIAWEGDEVELLHEGELLRLDRLVQDRGGRWWVLDYKSASRPHEDPALRAQLRRYGRAIGALHPGAPVELAFLTGDGRLVRVPAAES